MTRAFLMVLACWNALFFMERVVGNFHVSMYKKTSAKSAQAGGTESPYAADEHFSGGVQKQTYTLPWPFSGREYVVKCDAADLSGGGLRTYCRPSDATHVGAPAPGHVRASSETLWEFRPLDDGSTQVYFEGVVDPKGALPKWMVNEVGKHHSVNMVRAITSMAGRVLSSNEHEPKGWFSLLS